MTNHKFPVRGRSWEEVKAAMEEARKDDHPWHGANLFKPTYFAGDDIVDVANQAYQMYIAYNALYGTTSFPSLGRYEAEIVDMLLEMLNAPEGAGGNLSTGGTESNVMAVKTARDRAREHRPQVTAPEIVVPHTIHMSIEKAAHMFGIKLVKLTHSLNFRADVGAMARALNDNTIMLVASAPPYAYGVIDPVAEIAALAESHGLWMHVDACIGGFILPFARKLDFSIPDFDFSIPGVMSISADIHKFGYAAKGVSALLFRDSKLDAYRRFSYEGLTGLYSTPNITGSRSGGAVASAWAVMHYLGEEGYLKSVKSILGIKQRFMDGIRSIEGLEIWGEPQAYHFGFGSKSFDIFAVGDGMADRGWGIGRGMAPPSILLMINLSHEPIVDDFIRDLAEVVEAAKAGEIQARGEKAIYAV